MLKLAPFRVLVRGTTVRFEILSVNVADLDGHVQQNLARQYAANFGKHGTRDPPNHHLIQNTESVLVTTTMDLGPPRGGGADCPDDSAKLDISPRGFFADQFEVSFVFLSVLFMLPPG